MSETARPRGSLSHTATDATAPAGVALSDRVTPMVPDRAPASGALSPRTPVNSVQLTSADLRRLTSEPRYEVGELLGRGGIGEVRKARDVRIGRDVAMKTIRAEHQQDTELALRMLREAVLQGQLDHPAIVPVHDLGLGPDGLFFTMRRVQGVTLSEALAWLGAGEEQARQRYTQHRLLTIFVTVCLAVDYVHERGVVHRDLKPANVMLGDFGEVYVLDWGAARVVSDEGDDWERRKLSNRLQTTSIGTPGYMAPEQVLGEEPDPRTDIYALGSLLFEMLTLEKLHGGSPMQRLQSTLRSPELEVRCAALPPALLEACQRSLAVDRAERYGTARELADAVATFLDTARGDEMRHQLAGEAVRRGAAAAGAGVSARGEALRQAAGALALQPDNDEAAQVLARLLDTTPDELPPEADHDFAARREQQMPTRSFALVRIALAAILVVVMSLSPGGPLWWRAATLMTLALLTLAPWLVGGLDAPSRRQFSFPFLVLALVAQVLACGFLGPFMIGTTLLLLLGIAHINAQPSADRRIILGCTIGALLPLPLQRLGLLPALDPPPGHLGALAPDVTHFLLWVVRGGFVAGPLWAWSSLRRQQLTAERHLFWQAWQLRQLGHVPPSSKSSPLTITPPSS